MLSPKQSANTSIYQLKVTLQDTRPPIWRRIQVTGDTTLARLHLILQAVMGWEDGHLHQFIIGDVYYGTRELDFGFGREVQDELRVKLSQVAPDEKTKFIYEYDFGDSWYHQILVEKISTPEEGMRYPVCIKGKRACPPEDVGGVWSYESFLDIIGDPNHPEREDLLEWAGGEFDPEKFDMEAVNKELRRIR
ncbi:MAG TPA: plasmid pRiA4b ORF-3 family protein [Chloroflexia bacterium]|nr:plasmid pRiA4b ORF-3 family protein [Chloroflexia bacterium]